MSHDYIHLGSQANILVDKDGVARIAGLGSACILPHLTARSVEVRAGVDRLTRIRPPELAWPGVSPYPAEPPLPTKAGDMYSFGVVAWEVRSRLLDVNPFAHLRQVLTGRPPFFEMTEAAATYSMLRGARPPRPGHHETSSRAWGMIKRCWDSVPSRRMSAGEVVGVLEME